jgi:uncharacterized protein YcbK (DUF882 family)
MELTENFDLSEFACKDGTPVPLQYVDNVKELAKNLQVVRDYIEEALYLSSGYRTETYNKKVGGKKASKHLKAEAADVTARNYSPRKLYNIFEKLIREKKIKQGGLGLYAGFVHYDIRGTRVRWKG